MIYVNEPAHNFRYLSNKSIIHCGFKYTTLVCSYDTSDTCRVMIHRTSTFTADTDGTVFDITLSMDADFLTRLQSTHVKVLGDGGAIPYLDSDHYRYFRDCNLVVASISDGVGVTLINNELYFMISEVTDSFTPRELKIGDKFGHGVTLTDFSDGELSITDASIKHTLHYINDAYVLTENYNIVCKTQWFTMNTPDHGQFSSVGLSVGDIIHIPGYGDFTMDDCLNVSDSEPIPQQLDVELLTSMVTRAPVRTSQDVFNKIVADVGSIASALQEEQPDTARNEIAKLIISAVDMLYVLEKEDKSNADINNVLKNLNHDIIKNVKEWATQSGVDYE